MFLELVNGPKAIPGCCPLGAQGLAAIHFVTHGGFLMAQRIWKMPCSESTLFVLNRHPGMSQSSRPEARTYFRQMLDAVGSPHAVVLGRWWLPGLFEQHACVEVALTLESCPQQISPFVQIPICLFV